jgi:DNA-binding PadR family transcriptional regulator
MARGQLPAASLHVLLALLEGDKHGYAVMRDVEQLSDGAVKMGPGTLYGTIKRLLADGLIEEVTDTATPEADGERRRYYRLTASGEWAAATEVARLRTLLTRVGRLRPDLGIGIA